MLKKRGRTYDHCPMGKKEVFGGMHWRDLKGEKRGGGKVLMYASLRIPTTDLSWREQRGKRGQSPTGRGGKKGIELNRKEKPRASCRKKRGQQDHDLISKEEVANALDRKKTKKAPH